MSEFADIIKTALVSCYAVTLALIALYGVHRYVLVYLYIKHRKDVHVPQGKFTILPKVTIQLPMFNEEHVAERVIRATCQVDYPLDRLEIQVLDDSTDHSAEIARAAVEEWAAKGYPIKYIHRTKRTGYKAGALAEAMKEATGDFIAIFDADFLPPRDILHNVLDHFTDEKVGMVQIRWDHLNRNASLLTKSQAIFLDGHFVIEHTARNRSGRFMHFNGTAGVWRHKTIIDGGGWEHDTLTEDLDLSYRCQMKGWQFIYLPQYAAPAELPPEMISFKQQAHRWTKGSVQTCCKLLPKILRSKLPYRIKSEAFFHLTNTIVYPLMVFVTLMIYPTFLGYFDGIEAPLKHAPYGRALLTGSLFILATCSASTFFVFGQKELFGRKIGWQTVLYLPALMSLGVGVCLNNAKAVFEGLWSAFWKKGRDSEFVRTPKYGVTGKNRQHYAAKAAAAVGAAGVLNYVAPKAPDYLTLKRLMLPIIEIAFGCYMVCCMLIAIWWQFATTTIPFLLIFAGGYFYVGFSSIATLIDMQRQADLALAEETVVEPEPLST
jgi:cellulose synthase/poly-beta-1,6-N-acetylglucosamine synthase-like glycosyltransferase